MSKIKRITVYKKRTNTKEVWFGADYSDDELVSEIRVAADDQSELIASWSIEPKTDGVETVCTQLDTMLQAQDKTAKALAVALRLLTGRLEDTTGT